jgi:hypothetical protein
MVKDIMQSLTAIDGISKIISCRFYKIHAICAAFAKRSVPTEVDMADICVSSKTVITSWGKLPLPITIFGSGICISA